MARWLWLWMVLAGCEAELGPARLEVEERIELIGIDGRRLEDGARYGVPLDWGGARLGAWQVEPGEVWREAFVVVNGTSAAIAVELALEGAPEGGEWRLLEPTRAKEIAWRGPRLVAPGGRLDFDLAFAPSAEGLRAAALVVRIDQGEGGRGEAGRSERRVRVEGRCGGGPAGESGVDPPNE